MERRRRFWKSSNPIRSAGDAERQAIGVLRERGMLNLSSHRLDEWVVRTAIVRKLKELGVALEWLTEDI